MFEEPECFSISLRAFHPTRGTAACTPNVVPRVSQAPGFVSGYWTRKDDTGLSMILFDSEDAAARASEMIPATVPEHVTLEGVEVREVVAGA